MRHRFWLLLLPALSLGWGVACQPSASPPASDPSGIRDGDGRDGSPQPRLPTVTLWIGRQEITAEVARTRQQIETGMMFREEIGEDEGMLFVFPRERRAAFYMRNTYVPLSCAYIDRDGRILEIHDMEPLDETPVVASSSNVRYVLEVGQGWFEANGISEGTVMRTEEGTLEETFFGSEGRAREGLSNG